MKKDIIAIAFFAVMLAAIGVGCLPWNRQETTTIKPQDVQKAVALSRADSLGGYLRALASSPASGEVAKAMDGLCNAGTLFLVLGGVAVILKGRRTGFLLMGVGALMLAAGVLFLQYPWIVLAVAVVVGIVVAVNLIQQWREKEDVAKQLEQEHAALEVAAEVIQTIPEGKAVKKAFVDKGAAVVQLLDSVIDPIKEKLQEEGRIEKLDNRVEIQ